MFALLLPAMSFASEANLAIPAGIKEGDILYWGFLVTLADFLFINLNRNICYTKIIML